MDNTMPISDLRNYSKVTHEVREGSPVYLTKNGREAYVLVDADEYKFMLAKNRLLSELREAEIAAENGEPWYSLDEVKHNLGISDES